MNQNENSSLKSNAAPNIWTSVNVTRLHMTCWIFGTHEF